MMQSITVLVLGWLPAIVVALWEVSRQRQRRVFGVEPPVSAEAARWGLYAAAAWTLGYAGLALCWFDRTGLTWGLVAAVFCTIGTTGLLLWHVGSRYCPRLPRLREMRDSIYVTRLSLVARTRKLHRQVYLRTADPRDARQGEALVERCAEQLSRLQRALTTVAFVQRVRGAAGQRAELATLLLEQRRLVAEAQHFLAVTAAVDAIACLVPEPVMVW